MEQHLSLCCLYRKTYSFPLLHFNNRSNGFPARKHGFMSSVAIRSRGRNSVAEGEMTKRWVLSIVVCTILVLASTAVYGQVTTGRIDGTVTDPQGAAVAGAKVTVTNIAKG